MGQDVFMNFGFPKQADYSISHWLQSVKDDPLLNHRTTPELPQSADVVIIGSGMSGTVTVKHIIETWPTKKVLVIEARQFCSGATGRNAGHCKPDQWRGFLEYERAFGTEQALKILENEQQTWSEVVRYITENNVDCEHWTGNTLDVPITPEAAHKAHTTFERYRAAGGKTDHIQVTHDPKEAAEISQIENARACYAWAASTLHPWKLAAHIMRENLKRGVNLQTTTRAIVVVPSEKKSGPWVVKTDRGDIECSEVVHASNAYSSALEPSLRGLITPRPQMCNRVTLPKAPENFAGFRSSYGILLGRNDLISINPRLNGDGAVLFGGSNPGQEEFMRWLAENPDRCTDDGMTGYDSISKAVQAFAIGEVKGWSDEALQEAEAYTQAWSGIMGMSADGLPFVGELPGLRGQWVCAGHNGHGMARIFTAAAGLVKLMGGSAWAETQLPEAFQITSERAEQLREHSQISAGVGTRL
ncbi:NAD(P)/FAD-dependent oxidoreductase [Aspergillus saccharolyticus JOP 1030-1]|uniref:FAD dependent oxidoreductase n=1 Tax=Aspergillus saccharolyticus JOP 1030-1 TaxID=1450539 RepID=A0A318Z5Y1_9EURO|nr:FAD dependent oxidoreductase [Aspergillus saccharolyticus JOP 1030-1]PYH42519.1 FAD dependent oxidoreductase [Aspergillus saccharolyticus JOP 1030-1]